MLKSYFITPDLEILVASLFLLSLSVIFKQFVKTEKSAFVLLVLGAFGLRIFISHLDPFLNMWDEQYHALVAKNLSMHPLMPTLFNPPMLNENSLSWVGSHIWLHKQPLFLWQIALSIKAFGATVFAVRFPNVIMSTILTIIIYRIGKILVSQNCGFYAALFFAVNTFHLELVSGFLFTEHNDVAFMFYVTLSIWTWLEYSNKPNNKWLLLTGFFSGCAILNKWLPGLLVYSWWIAIAMIQLINHRNKKYAFDLIKSFIITTIVVLPWQIYILIKFPVYALHEFSASHSHFLKAIEGHGGDWTFHFLNFEMMYGEIGLYLFLAGIIPLIIVVKKPEFRAAIIISIVLTYLFYTLAATKMPAFTIICGSFVFTSMGFIVSFLIDWINKNIKDNYLIKTMISLILLTAGYILLGIEGIQSTHTNWKKDIAAIRSLNLEQIKSAQIAKDLIKDNNTIIFNTAKEKNAAFTFYSGYTSYDFVPDSFTFHKLKNKGVHIAVIDNLILPDYLSNNDSVIKIYPNGDAPVVKIVKLLSMDNKSFWSEMEDHSLKLNDKASEKSSKFKMFCYPNGNCYLKSENGNFVSSDLFKDSKLIADRTTPGLWEKFYIEDRTKTVIYFKTSTNKYVSADSSGLLRASAEQPDSSCYFKVIEVAE